MNNLIISATDGHFLLQSCKKQNKTHLFVNHSRPFSSGDILKKRALWTDTIAVMQFKKTHTDLDWQLYIWGANVTYSWC